MTYKRHSISINGRLTVSDILYFFILIVSVLTYCSFNKASNGLQYLAVSLLFFTIYIKKMLFKCLPAFFCMCMALLMFIFSGKVSERGFNAPIIHMLKFVYFFVAIVLASNYKNFKPKNKKILFGLICITIIVSNIISIYYAKAVDIYAIRYFDTLGFNNVWDFNQLYSLPSFIAISIYLLITYWKKIDIKTKLLLAAVILTSAECVLVSLYTFAVLLTIIGVAIAVFFYAFNFKRNKLIIFISLAVIPALLLIMIFSQQISDWLYSITEGLNFLVRGRIRYIIDKLLGTSHNNWYNSDRRDELKGYSIKTFKEHKLLGVGYSGYGYGIVGCHQEWPDMLAVFGILGTLIIAAAFIYTFFVFYKGSKIENKSCIIICGIMFFIQGFINPCLNMPNYLLLFVIAPNFTDILNYNAEYRIKLKYLDIFKKNIRKSCFTVKK